MRFRQALFWDTNPSKIDAKKNAQYVIERVLAMTRRLNGFGVFIIKNY